jgi:gamma-glutamyltranspeptidase/glutathione hydrolase
LAENICLKMIPHKFSTYHKLTCSILFLCLTAGCVRGQLGQNVSGQYKNGMVVCAYPDAAKAGLEVLKKGGNAVDAAVAVQFALAVTHPQAGNIGGGGFMVYRSASGTTNTLDFREKAPAQASANMYLDRQATLFQT